MCWLDLNMLSKVHLMCLNVLPEPAVCCLTSGAICCTLPPSHVETKLGIFEETFLDSRPCTTSCDRSVTVIPALFRHFPCSSESSSLISADGALRRPMTYDNHPSIHPSYSSHKPTKPPNHLKRPQIDPSRAKLSSFDGLPNV